MKNKKFIQSLTLSVTGRKGQNRELINPSPVKRRWGEIFPLPTCWGGDFGAWRKAFTLVELIIVITILAILATIAFMSFQGYTSKSRDSNRASTAKNIETWLDLFQVKTGVYPIQSTWALISVWGSGITVQWNLDLSIARVINLNEVPKDPKTGEMYNYISDTKGRGWKVLYYLENTPDFAFLTQSFADSETRIPIVKGQWPWVLLDTSSQMVTNSVDLFGAQSWTTYTILVSDGIQIPWTGLDLWGWFQNFAEKWGRLEAPKICPTGFIPVPWNTEFMQPWFCVAKYEMALEKDLGAWELDSFWNTWKWSLTSVGTWTTWSDGSIVSASWKYPIAKITQIQAIAACKNMGWTSHLITNNEWMTIARNIESNPVNWSWWIVWENNISNGVSNSDIGCNGTAKTFYPILTHDFPAKTWPWWNIECDKKRQLAVSNGEVIRDFAWNVREHVNKANTIDWTNFNFGKLKFDDNSTHWQVINPSTSNECYLWHNTGWNASSIPNNIRSKYWPSKSTYTNSNGIWYIHGWYTDTTKSHNVFLRGGDANLVYAWLYTLHLAVTTSDVGNNTGFRCAQ